MITNIWRVSLRNKICILYINMNYKKFYTLSVYDSGLCACMLWYGFKSKLESTQLVSYWSLILTVLKKSEKSDYDVIYRFKRIEFVSPLKDTNYYKIIRVNVHCKHRFKIMQKKFDEYIKQIFCAFKDPWQNKLHLNVVIALKNLLNKWNLDACSTKHTPLINPLEAIQMNTRRLGLFEFVWKMILKCFFEDYSFISLPNLYFFILFSYFSKFF